MTTTNNIGETVVEFGKYYGFNIWDWSAVLISVCSVFVAVVSLIVATKTLRSQKKTERNTLPVINKDVQLSLLAQSLRDLFDSYILIFALDFLLSKSNYTVKPSCHFWMYAKPHPNDIHESLFYSSETKLYPIHQLKLALIEFDDCLSSLEAHIDTNDSEDQMLEIRHLYENVSYIIFAYKNVLTKTFNFSDIEADEFIKKNFHNRKQSKFQQRFETYFPSGNQLTETVLPYVENSLASQYLSENFNRFLELSLKRPIDTSRLTEIKERLSHEVDCILLNTLQDGKPIDLCADDTQAKPQAHRFFETSAATSESPIKLVDPSPATPNKDAWIFYVRTK